MARSILGVAPAGASLDLSTATRSGQAGTSGAQLSAAQLQARLRQKRSTAYIEAMTRLDAGGHIHSPAAAQAFQEAIRREMPDVSIDSLPHGIVARCHLGPPYEVHTLDCSGQIVQHYKNHQALPPALERARSLALHPGYAFIEVYAQRLVAVSASGQTALIDL